MVRTTSDGSTFDTKGATAVEVLFSAPLGDFGIGYESALLFRDNVQHYLQAGRRSPRYPLVHAIADAPLDGEILQIKASRLWEEVSHAFERMRSIVIADLAVGIRTRAILTDTRALPMVRGTVLLRLTGWEPPFIPRRVRTIGELFDDFVNKLCIVTDAGLARGVVHVATRAQGVRVEEGSSVQSRTRPG
jgi:hypothetical protein